MANATVRDLARKSELLLDPHRRLRRHSRHRPSRMIGEWLGRAEHRQHSVAEKLVGGGELAL
jgi:hypothetical protein